MVLEIERRHFGAVISMMAHLERQNDPRRDIYEPFARQYFRDYDPINAGYGGSLRVDEKEYERIVQTAEQRGDTDLLQYLQ